MRQTNVSKAASLANELNKVLGEGTVRLGSDPSLAVQYLPTGVLPVDYLLGGGLPRGRFTEIFGDFSTLKSYVALRAIATTQSSGGVAALVDTEHSYDPEWLIALGGNPDHLVLQQPPTGESAVNVTEVLIRSGVDLIVWDSVAATLPKTEQEKRATDKVQPARQAALMSLATRRLNAANSSTAVLWINQTRMNVGITWGSPETTPGGKSLPFYASYRMRFSKGPKLKRKVKVWVGDANKQVDEVYGQRIHVTVEKSKLSAPYRDAWMLYDLEKAEIDIDEFVIALAIEAGLVNSKQRNNVTGEQLEWLKTQVLPAELIGTAYPGNQSHPSRQESVEKSKSSKSKDTHRTRTVVQGVSKKMGPITLD